MASSYVNDLRLEEIGSGEQSGTWGDTTNTNLELIAEGLSYGTEAITTNANTHTSTVADGATDPARSMYIEYTGTLDSACTITIAPNTLSRMHFIENGTSGSQNIIIKQGSGATITIPPGDTKAVYLDGAGSGAAVVDAFASLNVVDLKVQDDLTVTDDLVVGGLATIGETLAVTGVLTASDDVKLAHDGAILGFGANNDVTLTHVHDTGLLLNSSRQLQFGDSATHIAQSADGVLTITSDNAIVLDAGGDASIDIDGADLNIKDGGVAYLQITHSSPDLHLKNPIQDGDILLIGNDGGSNVTALKLDMSAAGAATLAGNLTVTGTTLNLPTANSYITGAGHNVFQVDANITYFYGGGGGVSFRTADNSAALINITNAGILSTVTPGTSNFRMGVNAGDAITANTNYNTVVGDESGTAINGGDQNTALGYKSSFSLVTGSNNTALGFQANFFSTGSSNTVVGAAAGTYNTTAANSTFVGFQAGQGVDGARLTGNLNTAVGSNAGLNLRGAATQNTYVGADTGAATTTGGYNTAMGYQALDSNQTGTYNQAFGLNAIHTLTTASYNCALGTYALGTTNGAGNIAMGHYAGIYVSSGTYNVILGYASGYSGNDGNQLTTGGSNILIGNAANVAAGGNNSTIQIGTGTGKGNGTGFITPGGGGVYQGNNASTWSQTSDRRLKKNIVDSTIGLAEINQLQVRNFEYRTEEEITELDGKIDKVEVEGVQVGVIAQEIQAILPKCVNETSQGVLSVNADNLTWHLVKSVQELSTALDAALARIATLEG